MTAPKLTPAEALAALRSRYDSDRTYEPWARILEEFGDGDAGKFASECWSCIGSALARLEALEAKPVEPAQPVPSDEEIVEELRQAGPSAMVFDALVGESSEAAKRRHLHSAVVLLARRIGVQGVKL